MNAMTEGNCSMCEASRDGSTSFAEQQLPVTGGGSDSEGNGSEWEDDQGGEFAEHKKSTKRQRVKTIWVGGLQDDWVEEVVLGRGQG